MWLLGLAVLVPFAIGARLGAAARRRALLVRGGALADAAFFRRPFRLRLGFLRVLRFLRLFRGRRVPVDREDRLPDLDLLSGLDLHVLHDAGDRRGDFDRRLVGLQLHDGLVFGDGVARLDEHADDVAGGDVLTEFGELEISHLEKRLSVLKGARVLGVLGCSGCWCSWCECCGCEGCWCQKR